MTSPGGLESAYLAARPALLRFLRARLRDPAAAEDVLQDLWLRLQSSNTGPVADPLAYLYRMAENLALDRRRSAASRAHREQDWTHNQVDMQSGMPVDAAASPERIVMAQETLHRVNRLLDALPQRTAYAFRAARFEQTPQKQIAAALGISLRAVEKHLQRAYQAVLEFQSAPGTENPPPQRPVNEGPDDANP